MKRRSEREVGSEANYCFTMGWFGLSCSNCAGKALKLLAQEAEEAGYYTLSENIAACILRLEEVTVDLPKCKQE